MPSKFLDVRGISQIDFVGKDNMNNGEYIFSSLDNFVSYIYIFAFTSK